MKQDDQLSSTGGFLLVLGALAFFLPMFDYQLLILSWLGGMEQPVGLSAMVIGGVLFAMGKLQQLRNASPVPSPTDPIPTGPDAPPATSAVESAATEGPIA